VTAPPEKLDAQTFDNQHRMPFQFLDHCTPATAAHSAIGTKHPLVTGRLAARPQWIIADRMAVPVQTTKAAAVRIWRLLEEKVGSLTPAHRTQNQKADRTSTLVA
jgi:hypothetical protein